MRPIRTRRVLCLGVLAAMMACAPMEKDVEEPLGMDEPSIGGEAALDEYPEHDPMRADEYDPGTETDAYMHRESNDDNMMEQRCMEHECPEELAGD